jgi:hypothetical protein
MKKSTLKTLALSKETIAHLSGPLLEQAAGGRVGPGPFYPSPNPTDSCDAFMCTNACPSYSCN